MVFHTKKELQNHLSIYWNNKHTVGFVPTMGALHQGHLSLLNFSLKQNKVTVLSIFVNPTQFNNPDDLKKYPRTLEKDLALVYKLNKNILIYAPEVSDIYGEITQSEKFNYDGLENEMEGKHRPGHFDGVGTVVKKLFEIVKPTYAYFGEKDFQQLQIVKKMVEKCALPVQIIGCPILREPNGLAMSSRNERLTVKTRENAKIIYDILQKSKNKFEKVSAKKTSAFVEKSFKKHPDFTLEYFEIACEKTLKTCQRKNNKEKYRAFIAVFCENVRLIDNIALF
jgi:pantoate--beta-alanine ligase